MTNSVSKPDETRNYGLLNDIQELGAYILGGSKVPFIDYVEDGNWEPFLPKYEPQAENFETNGCTVWGTQNQIEIFHKGIYSTEPNYSEVFNYLLAGVDPNGGADPQAIYENIRKVGLIENRLLPVPKTRGEFLNRERITNNHIAMGQLWLDRYELKHEWLWRSRPENTIEIMRRALHTSPLGVSVTAWYQDSDGTYSDRGNRNNHWCVCFRIDDEGYPWVFDSYDHSIKRLSKDHTIQRAKRIWLNKKSRYASKRQVSILQAIVNILMQKRTLVEVVEMNLGTDPTPYDDTIPGGAPDELACVDTATTLLRAVYPDVPKEVSTIRINDWFKTAPNWQKIAEPEPGAVIVSPTRGTSIGHIGFCMPDNTIASNNSYTVGEHKKGTLTKNYTFQTWIRRYETKLGLQVNIYKHT